MLPGIFWIPLSYDASWDLPQIASVFGLCPSVLSSPLETLDEVLGKLLGAQVEA